MVAESENYLLLQFEPKCSLVFGHKSHVDTSELKWREPRAQVNEHMRNNALAHGKLVEINVLALMLG